MLQRHGHHRRVPLLLGALVVLAGAGCAPKPHLALERARVTFEDAAADPDVQANAPVRLREAEQALQSAERTWRDKGDREDVDHLAYVADRRVAIARAVAQRKLARAEIRRLNEQRTGVRLEARTREVQRLEDELAELKAKKTDRGLVVTLGDILFEFGKADLKPGAMRNLYPLATFLRENADRNALIEGHTDSIGSDASNLDLSRRRAESVRGFLVANGIAPERIPAYGYGEAYPVASNTNDAGRQQNRRVEVVILAPGESPAVRMR